MKKVLLIVLIILLIVLPIGAATYYYHHPTHWKYNDTFIKKSSIEQIRERYGEFDFYETDSVYEIFGYKIKSNQKTTDGEFYDIYYCMCFSDEKLWDITKQTIFMERSK